MSEWLRSDALAPHLAGLEDVWRVEVARILPELLAARDDLPRPAPHDGVRRPAALLRGPGPGGARGAPAPAAADRRPAVVRPRDARVAPLPVPLRPRARACSCSGPRARRSSTPRTRSAALLRQLRSASQLAEIALEPLDAAETAALAAQVGNRAFDVDAATRLYRETEGNPLFIVETVRAESEGGPPGAPQHGIPELPPRAHAVIAGRLAQLSDQRARGRRGRGRDRARLRPPGARAPRGRRRGGRACPRRAVADAHRPRAGAERVRLHPRPAARRGLRRDERAAAAPPSPARGRGARRRARAGPRPRERPARRALRERRPRRAGDPALRAGGGGRPGRLRPRRGGGPRRARPVAAARAARERAARRRRSSSCSSCSPRATA